MNTSSQIANHFRQVFFGGNWTSVNLKDTLSNLTWQQAIEKKEGFNTIATLTYHITYYVSAVLKVLQGEALNASDKLSFDHPPINNQQDWEDLQNNAWANVEAFANLVEQLQEERLWQDFTDPKYGIYYRNIHGIIEHAHYHLGQIVILKKLLQ